MNLLVGHEHSMKSLSLLGELYFLEHCKRRLKLPFVSLLDPFLEAFLKSSLLGASHPDVDIHHVPEKGL